MTGSYQLVRKYLGQPLREGVIRGVPFMTQHQLDFAKQFVLEEDWQACEVSAEVRPVDGRALRFAVAFGCWEEREARSRAMAATPKLLRTLICLRQSLKDVVQPAYLEMIDEALAQAGVVP